MKLKSPFIISARLLPAIVVDNVTISFNPENNVFYFDESEFNYTADDYNSGENHDIQDCFVDILVFLSAFADAIEYENRTGKKSENKSLFPAIMSDWAIKNSDEFAMLGLEIEEFELITD